MAEITLAASETSIVKLFEALRNAFSFANANSVSFAGFTAGYEVAMHLEGGTLDLRSDGSISIKELDIKWDKLNCFVGFDIPEVCVGGFCIIPNPFGGCLVRAPRLCAFSASPDVGLKIPLDGVVTSEISLRASPVVKYSIDPGRMPFMDDWQAHAAHVDNKWQIFLDPETVDVDVFDIADIVGDLLENAASSAIDKLLWFLPGWARSLIKWILGPIFDLIRAILDLPDDIEEWFSDLLGTSLGLFDTILTAVADYFAAKFPIRELTDPYEILGPTLGDIPVLIPIKNLAVSVSDTELTLTADVG